MNKYLPPLVSSVIVLSFFALLELASRLMSSPSHLELITSVLREDSELIWTLKKNYKAMFFDAPVVTDQHGLRIDDRMPESNNSGEELLKVLVLGASPTFGWGVNFREIYSEQMKVLLQESGIKLQVVNAATIGYSSHQGLRFFKGYIDHFKPDIVTIPYVINDVDTYRFFRNNGIADERLSQENNYVVDIRNLLSNSAFYNLFRESIVNVTSKFKGEIDAQKNSGEVRVPLSSYTRNIEELIQVARSNNVVPILIKMPVNIPVPEKGSIEKKFRDAKLCVERSLRYNAEMEAISRRHGVEMVDIVKEFGQRKDYLFLSKTSDTIHPNRQGHKIIGEKLANKIKSLEILHERAK